MMHAFVCLYEIYNLFLVFWGNTRQKAQKEESRSIYIHNRLDRMELTCAFVQYIVVQYITLYPRIKCYWNCI